LKHFEDYDVMTSSLWRHAVAWSHRSRDHSTHHRRFLIRSQ